MLPPLWLLPSYRSNRLALGPICKMRGIGYLQDQFSFFVMVIRLHRRFNRRGNLLFDTA
jgi:hypothetical protein